MSDEDNSNKYGYRPTGYHYPPRKVSRVITVHQRELYVIKKQTADCGCGKSKRNKSKKSNGKQEEVIEVLEPDTDKYIETATSYYELTTNSSFYKQKRCVDIQCQQSEKRTVSVQKSIIIEQKSNQCPSNQECEPTPYHRDPALEQDEVTATERPLEIKTAIEAPLPNRASRHTQTKRNKRKFPCPCLSPDVRDNAKMCDANFYSWWAAQMAKDREAARLARKIAAERYALLYPDEAYAASGFVLHCRPYSTVQEEYREKLITEEVYENQYTEPKQASFCASPAKDQKQEKRWSFVKTLNNAFKTIISYSCYK